MACQGQPFSSIDQRQRREGHGIKQGVSQQRNGRRILTEKNQQVLSDACPLQSLACLGLSNARRVESLQTACRDLAIRVHLSFAPLQRHGPILNMPFDDALCCVTLMRVTSGRVALFRAVWLPRRLFVHALA